MYSVLLLAVFIAVGVASEEMTECQQHREREIVNPLPMRVIPECDDNGQYLPRQCFLNSEFCACWDKSGVPVTLPSNKTKACNCLVQQHEAKKKGLQGAYTPQCSEDGTYKKMQCHSSTGHCWCAHPVTGALISEPKRGKSSC